MTTPEQAVLKEAVSIALAGMTAAFGFDRTRSIPDGQGGAWVEIAEVELGDRYQGGSTFVIFLLPFNLPGADIYPLFVRRDLSRSDGQGLGEGFAATDLSWPGDPLPRPVTQVSRRTRANAFTMQTPLQKVEKVLHWIRTR